MYTKVKINLYILIILEIFLTLKKIPPWVVFDLLVWKVKIEKSFSALKG